MEFTIALIAGSGAFVMLLAMVFLRLTLTKRLKQELEPKGQYWHSGTLDFGLINTAFFGWACVIPQIENWENFKRIYKGLDVRSYATLIEKIISYSMIIGLLVFFVFGVWHAIIDTSPDL